MSHFRTLCSAAIVLTGTLLGGEAFSQQPFAYPNAGQTEAQQGQDRYECHQWSVAQTGFDPSSAPPLPPQQAAAPPPPAPRSGYSDQQPRQQRRGGLLGIGNGGMFQGGGMLGDAATGAALGAAGGALAGDAGEGAAIGALASTVLGAFSRSSSQPAPQPAAPPPATNQYYQQQQQAQAQSQQAYQQRMLDVDEYNRAYSACMTARDYTVN